MDEKLKKSQLARLGRIEGQVRGVARMIEDERYCIDVLTQIRAVRAALDRVEQETLKPVEMGPSERGVPLGLQLQELRHQQEEQLRHLSTRAGARND